MKRRRLELPRHNWHSPLKVARLPIPPPLRLIFLTRIKSHSPKKSFLEWVPKTGLEPAHLATHAPETCASTNSATWASSALQFLVCSINGAENGTRTRDPNLGKVVLYQLSYFRIFYYLYTLFRSSSDKHFSKCDAKVQLFSETAKLFPFFFVETVIFLYQLT